MSRPNLLIALFVLCVMLAAEASAGRLNRLSLDGTRDSGGARITPDGRRAIFRCDVTGAEDDKLYTVPIGGGEPLELFGTSGESVSLNTDYHLSPDGTRVLFQVDTIVGSAGYKALYSADVTGGVAALLVPSHKDPDYSHNPLVHDVTPDGTVVVQCCLETPNRFGLYKVDVAGGDLVRLNTGATAALEVTGFILDPDPARRRVFFTATDGVTVGLYWVGLDGVAPVKMWTITAAIDTFNHSLVCISPNGNRLVYKVYNYDADYEDVFSLPTAAGAPVKIAESRDGEYANEHIEFSPDGSRVRYLYCLRTGSPDSVLYSVPAGGGAAVRLSGDNYGQYGVYWYYCTYTQDGSRVIFINSQESYSVDDLWVVPVSGGEATRLNPPLPLFCGVEGFVQLPGREAVVYRAMAERNGGYRLYRAPLDGGAVTPLLSDLSEYTSVESFYVTPDGRQVVFSAYIGDATRTDLFMVPTSGGRPRKLTTSEVHVYYFNKDTISVDSRWVVFTDSGNLYSAWLPPVCVPLGLLLQ